MNTPQAHDALHGLLMSAFDNQNALNSRLDPSWAQQPWPYYRALWTEGAEASQHDNWQWWKTEVFGKPPSAAQLADIHMELCDMLHFGLSVDYSKALRESPERPAIRLDYYARMYMTWFDLPRDIDTFHGALERVVVSAIQHKAFDVEAFAEACISVNLSLPKLLLLYYGKATLNRFRWDNGYALPKGDPRKYIKMWPHPDGGDQPVEDNVHLSRMLSWLAEMNSDADIAIALHNGALQHGLYQRLAARYPGKAVPQS